MSDDTGPKFLEGADWTEAIRQLWNNADRKVRRREGAQLEREACAKVIEDFVANYPLVIFPTEGTSVDCISARAIRHACDVLAHAIRERSDAP